MAYYAALASLAQLLDNIILGDGYPTFLLGKHQVVKSLCQKVALLEESLQDYSSKGDEANDRVKARIRDVAYRAQDIIEFEILNHVSSQERAGVMKKIVLYRQKRCNKKFIENLHMVEKEMDLVVEEIKSIKERQRSEASKLNWEFSNTSVSEEAPTTENIMVGFDESLTVIKEQLCGHSSQLQVISIVGMGGIGKTTLARNTFDDALVNYHFDCRAWVTVSQDFHEKRVLLGIIRSLGDRNSSLAQDELRKVDDKDLKKLKEYIYKYLTGRRYLIVVDDVWDTKLWDDVMKWICPNDGNGSRIMLTTRLLDAAQYTGTSSAFLHEMQFLNKDQSWSLLQEKVFAKESCPPELEDIGKFIASKCCGLPLAIVVVAGILSNVKTPHNWKKIAANVPTVLSRTDDRISSILSLSYNQLPHQSKTCFLYMGRFPEDYEINVSNLIRLWVAEGFLKPTGRSKILEEIAEECLQDLVKRNLVLVTQKRPNGQFKFCVMHDVLRDFCRQRAFNEYFFHVEHKKGHLYPRGIEKICLINYGQYALNRRHQCNTGKLVRPIHLFSRANWFDFNFFEWDNLKLLRVLNSIDVQCASSIPSAIFRLFHLRYFSFGNQFKPNIPLSTFMLQNLQTLIIRTPSYLMINLPPQIWMMTCLRHVIVSQAFLPSVSIVSDVPVRKIECLQTPERVEDFRFTNEAIEMIPNLRKLKTICAKGESSCLNNLAHLTQLEELKIEFSFSNLVCTLPSPTAIAFPLNLKKLSLVLEYIYFSCLENCFLECPLQV